MFSITTLNTLSTDEQFEYILNNKNEIVNNKNINTDSIQNQKLKEVISSMAEKNCDITIACCAIGYLDFLQYLSNKGMIINGKLSFYWAAINGNLDCLEFLDSLGNEEITQNQFNTDVVEVAAMNGHIECLKFLVNNNYPFDEDAVKLAERRGEQECAEYLRTNNNNPFDNIDIYDMAISEGLFENEQDIINQLNEMN